MSFIVEMYPAVCQICNETVWCLPRTEEERTNPEHLTCSSKKALGEPNLTNGENTEDKGDIAQ